MFFNLVVFGQTEYKKNKIYVKFEMNDGNAPFYRGVKRKYKNSIKFNLLDVGSLIYSLNSKADTLRIDKISSLNLYSGKEVEGLVLGFKQKMSGTKPKKPDEKLYQFYDKNDIFNTYLVEFMKCGKAVIYPVKWRNQKIGK